MRCIACDAALTDREATRKFLVSGTYTDMCTKCLRTIQEDAPTEDDISEIDVQTDEQGVKRESSHFE